MRVRFVFLLLTTVLFVQFSGAQKVLFESPKTYKVGDVQISIQSGLAEKGLYKFKMSINNSSLDDYCLYHIDETIFKIPGLGDVVPESRRKPFIIEPGKVKTIVAFVRTNRKKATEKKIEIQIGGLYQGTPTELETSLPVYDAKIRQVLEEKQGDVEVKFIEVFKKRGVFEVVSQVSFKSEEGSAKNNLIIYKPMKVKANYGINSVEFIEPSVKIFTMTEGVARKMRFMLKNDKESVSLDFNPAIKQVKLHKVALPTLVLGNGVDANSEFLNDAVAVKNVEKKDQPKISDEKVVAKVDKKAVPKVEDKVETKKEEKVPTVIQDKNLKKEDVKSCQTMVVEGNGRVKTNLVSSAICFNLTIDGKELSPTSSKNLTFNLAPKNYQFAAKLANGKKVERDVFIRDGFKELFFQITESGGEYSIDMIPSKSVKMKKRDYR
jgi:hypothetical protein